MARKKEYRFDVENPITRERLNYIMSQYPNKNTQQVLDMAIECLFKVEAENIQKNLSRLMGLSDLQVVEQIRGGD